MSKKHISKEIQWLNTTDIMFRDLTNFYPATSIGLRFHKISELKYSDRVFDTLARMLQIYGPCCAVAPLITPNVENDTLLPLINKLYISFNSTLTDVAIQQLFNNVKKTIIDVLTNQSIPTETKIFDLVTSLILNNNKCYDFKRNALTFVDETIKNLQAKKSVGIELNDKQQDYIKEAKSIKEAIKNIKFEDNAQKRAECVDTYIKLINCSKMFLATNPISTVDQFMDVNKAEVIKSYLFKVYRIYLDSKKLVELLPQYYQLEFNNTEFFDVIPNPRGAHAETNLADQLFISNHIISIPRHMGISKLSCQICYDTFTEKDLVVMLLGCHGTTAVGEWGLPLFFSTKNGVELLLTKIIPQVVKNLSTLPTDPPNRFHLLRQETDLSDDESEFQPYTNDFYPVVQELATLGDLHHIHYDMVT
jgi:OTT_1508-like deaminase